MLKPTKIYVKEVLKLLDKKLINGCANITGGGLADNIKRVIPDNLVAEINLDEVKTLKIFKATIFSIRNGVYEKATPGWKITDVEDIDWLGELFDKDVDVSDL